MATHSRVLAWRIPGMAEPGGLPSMGSQSRTQLKWLSSSSIYCHVVKAEGSTSLCYRDCSSMSFLGRFPISNMLHQVLAVTWCHASGLPTVWDLTWKKVSLTQDIMLLPCDRFWCLPEIKLKYSVLFFFFFYVNLFTSMFFTINIFKLTCVVQTLTTVPCQTRLRQKEKSVTLILSSEF